MDSASCNPLPMEACWNTSLCKSILLTLRHTKIEEACQGEDWDMRVNSVNTLDESVIPLPQVKTTYPFRSQESIHSVTHSLIYLAN